MEREQKLKHELKILLYVFIAGLIASGITAFPIYKELSFAENMIVYFKLNNALSEWIQTVHRGVSEVDISYPFILYGTDWLAFAHLAFALLFAGIIKDPVRNIWILQFGIITCAGIFPLAFIAGSIRGIPFFWQLIDCSFGLCGGIILWMCYRRAKELESGHFKSLKSA